MNRLRLALTLLLPLLAGCGAAPAPGTASTASLSGNWEAAAQPDPSAPTVLPSPIANFSGALQFSGASVTGTLRAFAPAQTPNCPSVLTDIPVTGTLDASNNLTLTAPLSGGIATITATLPQNLHTFISGTYSIAGGACPMPGTAMRIAQFAPLTGVYSGTFNVLSLTTSPPTPVPGTATAVTATLNQSSTPNADGQFPLTGTVTATGACIGVLTIANGLIYGNAVISHPFSTPVLPGGDFLGAMDPTATTFTGALGLFATCNYQSYQGTLTRQ